ELVIRPEAMVGKEVGNRLANGERVRDDCVFPSEGRHGAARRDGEDLSFRVLLPQPDTGFLEGDGCLAHQQPGAQAPAGPVLVANGKFEILRGHGALPMGLSKGTASGLPVAGLSASL